MDFFQKALKGHCLHAAARYIVSECKKRYSGFYATLHANGLPKECGIEYGGRFIDFENPIIQKFQMNLRGNVLDTLMHDNSIFE